MTTWLTKATSSFVLVTSILLSTPGPAMAAKAPKATPSTTTNVTPTLLVTPQTTHFVQGSGSKLSFKGQTNIGNEVIGTSHQIAAQVMLQSQNIEKSKQIQISGSISLNASSLNTGMKMRDDHMCKPEFLDCEKSGKNIKGDIVLQDLKLNTSAEPLDLQDLQVDMHIKDKIQKISLQVKGPFQQLSKVSVTDKTISDLSFEISGALDYSLFGVQIPTPEIISMLVDVHMEKIVQIEGIINLTPGVK